MTVIYAFEPRNAWTEEEPDKLEELRVSLVKGGILKTCSITNSKKFPYPFQKPDKVSLGDYFGEDANYEQINRELDYLYNPAKGEYSVHDCSDPKIVETICKKFRDMTVDRINKSANYSISCLEKSIPIVQSGQLRYDRIIDEFKKRQESSKEDLVSMVNNFFYFRESNEKLVNFCANIFKSSEEFWVARIEVDGEKISEVKKYLDQSKLAYKVLESQSLIIV